MAAAGLCVVAYAFYTLLDSGSSRAGPARHSESRSSSEEAPRRSPRSSNADDGRAGGPEGRRGRPKPVRPVVRVSPPPEPADQAGDGAGGRPSSGLPPRPKPEISLEEARKQFSDLLAELDRLAATGATLSSPEWVDYYKRGNDALLPLQQHLDTSVADEADELRRANEDLRAKLRVLEPGGAAAAAPQ